MTQTSKDAKEQTKRGYHGVITPKLFRCCLRKKKFKPKGAFTVYVSRANWPDIGCSGHSNADKHPTFESERGRGLTLGARRTYAKHVR